MDVHTSISRLLLLFLAASVAAACESGGETASGDSPSAGDPPSSGDSAPTLAGEAPSGAPGSGEPAGPAWQDEGFRTAFSILDNRHLIHHEDTGIFVDFGSPGGLKYIQGRWRSPWQAGEMAGDRPVAYTDGIGATFRIPLTEVDGDQELVLRMRAAGDDQRMDVFVNSDDALPTVMSLPSDFGEVRVAVPASRLVAGENTIRFHFRRSVDSSEHGRTAGGFDWARLQPPGADPPAEHADGGAFEVVARPEGESALAVPAYGRAALYVTVPEQARLRLYVVSESGQAAPAEVRLLIDGQAAQSLWAGTATSDPSPVEADLSAWAGEAVRLELAGNGPVAAQRLLFIDPRLVVPEQPVAAGGAPPQNAMIWLIDTLRADHMTLYNPNTEVQTPNLTAFGERCRIFRRTLVQGNSSLPSSASIHSSTYPAVHGINDGETRLSRDLIVLGQAIEEADFDTALFSSNGYVTQSRGFGRGYDEYRNLIHEPGRPDSEYLWPITREWLEGRQGRWLTFLNTIDPHVPYDPPEDLLRIYHPEPYNGRIRPRATGELLDSLSDGGISDGDLRYLRALHNGEITYNDVWFGHMVETLTELGALDETVVVITSDHGEGFMEHGRVGHGTGVNEEVVHIPLLVCHPRSLGTGWVETEVESIDIYPTLLDLLDVDIPETVQGESLVSLMTDPTPVMNRPAFAYHQDFLRGMRLGRWKYQLGTGDNDELFDLRESAIEGEDRRTTAPIAHRHARDVMAFHLAFVEQWRKTVWGHPNNHDPTFAAHLDAAAW